MSAIPNLRHLCALRAVLETGGVSAAACAIHLTQPAAAQAELLETLRSTAARCGRRAARS